MRESRDGNFLPVLRASICLLAVFRIFCSYCLLNGHALNLPENLAETGNNVRIFYVQYHLIRTILRLRLVLYMELPCVFYWDCNDKTLSISCEYSRCL